MGAPTFWEDNRRAQELIRERTEISRLVTRTKELAGQAEDLGVMLELAAEHEDHGLDKALDYQLIDHAREAIEHQTPVEIKLPIRNVHRTVGAMLSGEIARRYGSEYQEAAGHGHMLMLEDGWEQPFKDVLSWMERAIDER